MLPLRKMLTSGIAAGVAAGVVVAALSMVLATAASALPFTDGTFASGDWSTADNLISGSASSTTTQQLSGGNPGAFRETTLTFATSSQLWVESLYLPGIYDPAAEGALTALDVSLETIGGVNTGVAAIVVQDGVVYYSIGKAIASHIAWTGQSFSVTGALVASDFDTNPNAGLGGNLPNGVHPDFSAGGSPLLFGYAVGNGSGGNPITVGVDNWSVTAVPEPSTAVLLGGGLFALAARRRHRRSGPVLRPPLNA